MTLFFFFLPSPQMRRQQQQHRQHFIAALLREKNDRQKTALRLLFSAVSLLCCLKLHLDHGQLAKAVSGQATHWHREGKADNFERTRQSFLLRTGPSSRPPSAGLAPPCNSALARYASPEGKRHFF
jgi:hypothetical protein